MELWRGLLRGLLLSDINVDRMRRGRGANQRQTAPPCANHHLWEFGQDLHEVVGAQRSELTELKAPHSGGTLSLPLGLKERGLAKELLLDQYRHALLGGTHHHRARTGHDEKLEHREEIGER